MGTSETTKVLAAGGRSLSAWSRIEDDDREDYAPPLLTVLAAGRSLARNLKKTRKELRRLRAEHEALLQERAASIDLGGSHHGTPH